MTTDRIDKLKARVAEAPGDARARLFLATELYRKEAWIEAALHYEAYLATAPPDPASARLQLGLALARSGRAREGAAHLERAVDEALRYGHDGLAEEIRSHLAGLEDGGGAREE